MLLSLNLPFSDVRRFASQDVDYLKEPIWSKQGSSPFVPYFGSVERCKRKNICENEIFGNENEVSDIHKSIGFHKTIQLLDNQASHCVSKRLWFDEQAVGFFEIVIDPTQGKKADLKAEQVEQMLNRFLRLEVGIIKPKERSYYVCELYQASKYLTKLFETATKNIFVGREFPESIEGCVVRPGIPILFLEYNFHEEMVQVPYWIKSVNSPNKTDLRIHYSFLPCCGQGFIRIWLLGGSSQESISDLRKLKSTLLNIHIEHECLRSVLKEIARGEIEILSRSNQSQILQHYLADSIQRISLLESEITRELGINFHDYRLEYTDPLRLGEQRRLLERVSAMDFRRNILDKVEEYIDEWSRIPVYPQCHFCNRDCSFKVDLIAHENKKNIQPITHVHERGSSVIIDFHNAKNNNVGDINQVAAQTIQNAFNKVEQSNVSQELKDKLVGLAQSVSEMSTSLPDAKQARVAQDLKTLTDEVTSGAPRKKWCELSAEGLIDAANAVGEIATPVVTATKAILALLAV